MPHANCLLLIGGNPLSCSEFSIEEAILFVGLGQVKERLGDQAGDAAFD